MSKKPIYELFEVICRELSSRNEVILDDNEIGSELIEEIKEYFNETDSGTAFESAIEEMKNHLIGRGTNLPFCFKKDTREFKVLDKEYVDFIYATSHHRGVGGRVSREFEKRVLERLSGRLTGEIHRVGRPRTKCKKKAEMVRYLRKLGFDKNVFESRDKDGGFDILWLPPIGAIPLRPVISIQCKNSSFDEDDANKSVGKARRTLERHSHFRSMQLHFVIFNDYIDESYRGRAIGWQFIPLGLTDVGTLQDPAVKTFFL
jgi:hypothetical protein